MVNERRTRLNLHLGNPVTIIDTGARIHTTVIELETRGAHEHFALTDAHPSWFHLETGLEEYRQRASLVPGHV